MVPRLQKFKETLAYLTPYKKNRGHNRSIVQGHMVPSTRNLCTRAYVACGVMRMCAPGTRYWAPATNSHVVGVSEKSRACFSRIGNPGWCGFPCPSHMITVRRDGSLLEETDQNSPAVRGNGQTGALEQNTRHLPVGVYHTCRPESERTSRLLALYFHTIHQDLCRTRECARLPGSLPANSRLQYTWPPRDMWSLLWTPGYYFYIYFPWVWPQRTTRIALLQ